MKGIYLETHYKGVLKVSDGPMTVLEVHRALQEWADDIVLEDFDKLDITDFNPSSRLNDYMVMINPPYKLTKNSFKFITQGVIYSGGEIHYSKLNKQEMLNDFDKWVLHIQKTSEKSW
tara:strand:- start:357 stop:710 length:354 start_codon:yes stop_codon:yes gene_type:complete